ncbi:MAG: 4-hydroxy-3-methylbut-2-enyl diphosphate reductase [Chloroflexota bacterium]
MEVILAKHMGFCFGVRRAEDMIEEAARRHGTLNTLGPLVHNRQVTERLEGLGVTMARSLSDLDAPIVAVSAHGAPPETFEGIEAQGRQVIDGTCPFVRKAQQTAREMAEAGYAVLIFGDPNHTEVKGILGWAGSRGRVVQSPDDLPVERPCVKIGVVSQTTQNSRNLAELVQAVVVRWFEGAADLRAANTICHASVHRQQAAEDLAARVDAMVVIGGRDSANTARLREVCARTGTPTYQVEDAGELDPEWFVGTRIAGVTAGASTPDWVIAEVTDRLRAMP